MKRFTLFLCLLLAIVIAVFIGLTRLADIVASHISEKLQVAVSIDSIGLRANQVKVKQLQIGNPRGYSLPKGASADEIIIGVPVTHFFHEDMVVDQVTINGVTLGLEFDSPTSGKGNWTVIFSNLKQSTQKSVQEESNRTVLIRNLVVTNVNTQLLFHGKGSIQDLPNIDRMEFTNITSTGGIPTDQLLNSILGQMLREIFFRNHLDNMLDSVLMEPLKLPEQAADTIIAPFKQVFP